MGAISLGLTVLGLLVDYFRWTQLTPMVLAWAALLGLLLVFAFVNFQAEGLTVLEALARLWERYPWLPRIEDPGTTGEDGAWHLDGASLRGPVLAAWGVISMVLWGVAWLWSLAFGASTPWPLRRKLKVALGAGAAGWLAFVAIYLLSSETFHDGPVRWLLTFAATVHPAGDRQHVLADGGARARPLVGTAGRGRRRNSPGLSAIRQSPGGVFNNLGSAPILS
jgi:hypothetical protein